jgi:hypothetical protein
MNSIYRYLTRITVCSGLWIMIFIALGTGDDSAFAKSRPDVNSEPYAKRGGKITMYNLSTDSPNKPVQLPEKIRVQHSSSAKIQLQYTLSKRTQQTATAKSQLQRPESKSAQQPDANQQLSDASVPKMTLPPPDVERIVETPEFQQPIVSEPMKPDDPAPLVIEASTQPMDADTASFAGIKEDVIQPTTNDIFPKFLQQLDSVHDTLGIIARLLFKFSLIIVSCVALCFSFSALQIAKTNQRMQCRVVGEKFAG